ncbi:glycoside hydrolase 5 family protein [Brachybacterium sp. AOP25-B2-12]|uniref:glycoside hydrolase 5 family protein n=1 Tax=Brachybacterium sp. AOP25-B2-12 TaxID=3457710 RepID=UPI0040349DBB
MNAARIGVNYTPRRGWFHAWQHLDPGEIREDLTQIAGLGLDHVRIFPLWPLLQPNRTLIPPQSVQDVLTVADLAGEQGLDVSVDLLQGHLSSFDFLPAWVSTWHRRNIFTDPDVVAAQHTLARVLGTELAQRPHVTGMTLGNEIGQFARPDHPDREQLSPAQATAWTADLLRTVEGLWPDGRHHHSFDDAVWFTDEHPFTPASAVELGASTTVHSWVFTGAAQRLGAHDPGLALFGRYLIEVADLWHRLLDVPSARRIWLQEIGAPTPWVRPEDAAQFADASLRAALAHPRVEAATWWCSHDVARSLADFPEVEYTLGLFDEAGRVKPIGEAVARIAAELREGATDPENPATVGPRVSSSAASGSVPSGSGSAVSDRSASGGSESVRSASRSAPSGAEPGQIRVPRIALDGSDRSVLAPRGEVFRTWIDAALTTGPARLEPTPG